MKLDYPNDPPQFVLREVTCPVCLGAKYLPGSDGDDTGCGECGETGKVLRPYPLRQALWELAQASPGVRGQSEAGVG